VANLFPAEEMPAEEEQEINNEVEFGSSWQFDYDVGEFVLTPTGKVAAANEKQAWVEWCKKALMTARYQHLIYSRDHGQEFDDVVRIGISREGIESEIQRITTETLMVDPRTASVSNFTFDWQEEHCFFSCEIKNVREETDEIESEVIV